MYQFYGCLYDLEVGKKLGELELLIKPTRVNEVPEKITKITGISQAMLEGKPTFNEVADMIGDLIYRSEALCGHNVTFDVDVINMEFSRLKLPPPVWPNKDAWTCTV